MSGFYPGVSEPDAADLLLTERRAPMPYQIDRASVLVAEHEYPCPDGCGLSIEPGDELVRSSNGRDTRYVLAEHLGEY